MHTRRFYHYGQSKTSSNRLAVWLDMRVPFKGGSLKGVLSDNADSFGQLPDEWVRAFETRQTAKAIDYVVYSYATPIAWHDTDTGWVIPRVRYSATTSEHQGTIRVAASNYLE